MPRSPWACSRSDLAKQTLQLRWTGTMILSKRALSMPLYFVFQYVYWSVSTSFCPPVSVFTKLPCSISRLVFASLNPWRALAATRNNSKRVSIPAVCLHPNPCLYRPSAINIFSLPLSPSPCQRFLFCNVFSKVATSMSSHSISHGLFLIQEKIR